VDDNGLLAGGPVCPDSLGGTLRPVRLTDFWERMDLALGQTYSRSWARDIAITDLGGQTVEQALAAGVDPKEVWRAVHSLLGLPARDR
jgi:hypothetical protein